MIRLQRDVALVEDRVRTLQRSVDEKLPAVTTLLQQTLQGVNQVNTTNKALRVSIDDRALLQQQGLDEVQSLAAKLDRA